MKIGLALGSGAARGWSHIGVINRLSELGIVPDIVCGTSIGALVGASYVYNDLSKLEEWVRSLTRLETAKFFEINASLNGFVATKRLHYFLNEYVASDGALIESGSKRYGAVATELDTGREVWFTEGSVLEAVWSSIALPGLFPVIKNNHKWLIDGGLVNPVPISVCRALGADIVIAVNLSGSRIGRRIQQLEVPKTVEVPTHTEHPEKNEIGFVDKLTDLVADYTTPLFATKKSQEQSPNLFDAIAGSVNIIQDRITKARMAGDPPDILLSPKLSNIGLLEFYRASEAIDEGSMCVQRMLPEIKYVLDIE